MITYSLSSRRLTLILWVIGIIRKATGIIKNPIKPNQKTTSKINSSVGMNDRPFNQLTV